MPGGRTGDGGDVDDRTTLLGQAIGVEFRTPGQAARQFVLTILRAASRSRSMRGRKTGLMPVLLTMARAPARRLRSPSRSPVLVGRVIGRSRDERALSRPRGLEGLLECFWPAGRDDDVGALGHEPLGDGQADSSAGPVTTFSAVWSVSRVMEASPIRWPAGRDDSVREEPTPAGEDQSAVSQERRPSTSRSPMSSPTRSLPARPGRRSADRLLYGCRGEHAIVLLLNRQVSRAAAGESCPKPAARIRAGMFDVPPSARP